MEDVTAYVTMPPSARDGVPCAGRSSALQLVHPAAQLAAMEGLAAGLHQWPPAACSKSRLAKAKLRHCLSRRRAAHQARNAGQQDVSSTAAVPVKHVEEQQEGSSENDEGEVMVFGGFSPGESCSYLSSLSSPTYSTARERHQHTAAHKAGDACNTTQARTATAQQPPLPCPASLQAQGSVDDTSPQTPHPPEVSSNPRACTPALAELGASEMSLPPSWVNSTKVMPMQPKHDCSSATSTASASLGLDVALGAAVPAPNGAVSASTNTTVGAVQPGVSAGANTTLGAVQPGVVASTETASSTVWVQFEEVPSTAQLQQSRSLQVGGLSLALRTASSCTSSVVAAVGVCRAHSNRTAGSLTPGSPILGSMPMGSSEGQRQHEAESSPGMGSGCGCGGASESGGGGGSGPGKDSWVAAALGMQLPLPEWAVGMDELGYIKRPCSRSTGTNTAQLRAVGDSTCIVSPGRTMPSLPVPCQAAAKKQQGLQCFAAPEVHAPHGAVINVDHFLAPTTAVPCQLAGTSDAVQAVQAVQVACQPAGSSYAAQALRFASDKGRKSTGQKQGVQVRQVPQVIPWYDQPTPAVTQPQCPLNLHTLPPALCPVLPMVTARPPNKCGALRYSSQAANAQQQSISRMRSAPPEPNQQQSTQAAPIKRAGCPHPASHQIAASVPSHSTPAPHPSKALWPWFNGLFALLDGIGAPADRGSRAQMGRQRGSCKEHGGQPSALQHVRSLR